MDRQQILLEKRLKFDLESLFGPTDIKINPFHSIREAATVAKNLESFGFTLSQDFLYTLSHYPATSVAKFYSKIIPVVKKMVGAHVKMTPMYPNFPRQVMLMSEVELYLNAIVHYWSGGNLFPLYIKEDREPLKEKVDLKVINLGSFADYYFIFTQLLGSNTSLSESDKKIVEFFVKNHSDQIALKLPESIPQKENLALVIGEFVKNNIPLDCFKGKVKTATDLLRIAVQLSGGDISLAQNTKFKKFGRSLRRFFLANLDVIPNADTDMARYPGQWKRLGEILHPGEYAKHYPNAANFFKRVREDQAVTTNALFETIIRSGEPSQLREIAKYPGDFTRRLHELMRKFEPSSVLKLFTNIVSKVSTPVLLTTQSHFIQYGYSNPKYRIFFPKGSVAKAQVVDNNLKKVAFSETYDVVSVIQKELTRRFSALPKLGKVYIDPQLSNFFLPTAQRSSAKSLETITRGSKVALPDKDTVRFFIWWKNSETYGRTDIDLSAKMISEDWARSNDCSFYNLKGNGFTHSGDITNAPNGAAEFIDIHIPTVLNNGYRYVIMMINSYSGEKYCDLPECFAGFMGRSAPQSGEVFEPSTVLNKFDVASASQLVAPAVFDLKERKFIWLDMTVSNRNMYNTASGRNGNNTMKIAEAMVEMYRPNLYNLLETHAEARGTLVGSPEEADVVWSVQNNFHKNFDLINSEFLV